jgi:hypothetical protein
MHDSRIYIQLHSVWVKHNKKKNILLKEAKKEESKAILLIDLISKHKRLSHLSIAKISQISQSNQYIILCVTCVAFLPILLLNLRSALIFFCITRRRTKNSVEKQIKISSVSLSCNAKNVLWWKATQNIMRSITKKFHVYRILYDTSKELHHLKYLQLCAS